MNSCNSCGVELDNDMDICPLCGLSVNEKGVSPTSEPERTMLRDKMINDFKNLTKVQKHKLFWEISGVILVSGMIVTVIINLIINKHITWAKYNLIASFTLFLNISVFTFWLSRRFLLFSGSLIANTILLLLLDLFGSNMGWGTKLGIPILVSFYIILLAVFWLVRITHQRGFNILAIIIIAIGLFVICIEAIISYYFLYKIRFSWSIIAGASVLPISVLLFYVHYRLKTGIDLKRFFHI